MPADLAPPAGEEVPERAPAIHGGRAIAALFIVLALLPLFASVVAVAPGWLPVGDDATIEMRGRDLLTPETPLLGMPSAVGEHTGRPVHHPGPLELWWVGAWVRTLGFAQASLLAAAAAWGTATTSALLLARRIGGTPLLALSSVVAAALTWSLRGEVPVTPFNVHAIVVPLAAYLLALVAWHAGVRWAGVAAIVLGSWAAQAHLTAVGPIVAAGVVAAGAVLVRGRRQPGGRSSRVGRAAIGAGVLALCWVGPAIDVITNDGGNVGAVLGARSDLASEAIGLGTAVDIVVRAIGWRPVWASAGAHPSQLVLPAGAVHWATAVGVVAIGAVGALRRRRTHPGLAVALTATVASIGVGAVLAARFPGEYLSLLALHNHLWLWPLSAVLWGAAAVSLGLEVRDLVDRLTTWRTRLAPALGVALPTAVLLVVGAASIGEPHRNLTLPVPTYVRTLGDQALARLDRDETYLVTISGDFDAFFVEVGLLAYLEDRGLDVVGPTSYRRAFGARRTDPGPSPVGELAVDLSWDPDRSGASGRVVGEHRPPDDLLAARERAEDRLVALLRSREGALPLYGMATNEDAEVRRFLREELDGFLLAGLVPEWLPGAAETREYLDLWREPVLHATLRLVPSGS